MLRLSLWWNGFRTITGSLLHFFVAFDLLLLMFTEQQNKFTLKLIKHWYIFFRFSEIKIGWKIYLEALNEELKHNSWCVCWDLCTFSHATVRILFSPLFLKIRESCVTKWHHVHILNFKGGVRLRWACSTK